MQAVNFDEVLDKIIATDPRYTRDAYCFVREALDYTQKMVSKSKKGSGALNEVRHVSGQELLQGIREFALKQYGPMTETLFRHWGITRCEDFGEIVFNMVENRLLGKTEQDSRTDFKDGYDFTEAFRRPFLPTGSGQAPKPASEVA